MKKLNLIAIVLTSLLYSCASQNPTACDCIDETVEQAIQDRENGLLTFDAIVTPICKELLDGITPEQRMELDKLSRQCPNYSKLDSLQKLKEKDWLEKIENN
jgi:hypothetical protein